MPDSTVTVAFTEQYEALIWNLAQQKGSKFRNRVKLKDVSNAKNAYVERLGLATVQQITSRHGDTPLNEIEHTRRMLTPADYNTATLLDKQDEIKMLIDPTNDYAVAQSNALGRQLDDLLITAATEAASTGVTGAGSIDLYQESIGIDGDGDEALVGTLPAVATIAGMTLEKILVMVDLFNRADVDADLPKHWAVAPACISYMLALTQIGSADYNTVRALQAGKVETYAGFSFFWTNRLLHDVVTETSHRTLAWAQPGICLGEPKGITARISERDDKNYTTQVYAEMSAGAVRVEGVMVHECLNKLTYVAA